MTGDTEPGDLPKAFAELLDRANTHTSNDTVTLRVAPRRPRQEHDK